MFGKMKSSFVSSDCCSCFFTVSFVIVFYHDPILKSGGN